MRGFFDRQHQPVFADGEANTRRGRTAEHLREAVVAPAAEQRVLRAQRAAGDLKRRARVVVEPADQTRSDLVGNPALLELRKHAVEVLPALGTQMVEDARELGDDGLVGFHLAVKHAQRVRLRAALAVHAHRGLHAPERAPQHLDVFRPALRAAHRIEQQRETPKAHPFQEQQQHLEDFGVNRRVVGAQDFRADLVELPVTPLLRALAAEHRTHIVELVDSAFVEQAVLDVGAHHGRRGLGSEGQRLMVAVLKGVHFLGHDVGVGADAARKEFGPLEDRRSDLAEVVRLKHTSGPVLDLLPTPGLGRQEVARPFHGTDWLLRTSRHSSLVTALDRSRR